MTLADRLRQAMTHAGINQKQLADAVGVKPPSVNGWLSAKAKFLRGVNLLRAAEALGVNEEWLATGRGPMLIAGNAPMRVSEPAPPLYGESQPSSQPGRPDPATLRRAMRLLSFVSQILGEKLDFSEDADALLAAYDLVSRKPSEFDLEDASKRMSEWLRARGGGNGRMDGRPVVGSRGKVGDAG